jgi:hypothetical protein
VTVEVLVEVLPKVIKAFRCRVRGVCRVPAMSSQRRFEVFNVLLAEISGCASGVFLRDFSVRGRCEGNEVIANITYEHS